MSVFLKPTGCEINKCFWFISDEMEASSDELNPEENEEDVDEDNYEDQSEFVHLSKCF